MKMANQSETARRRLRALWLMPCALLLGACLPSSAINSVAPSAAAVTQEAPSTPSAPPATFSAGVADILKMVDARVDLEVIQTYVRNSPTAYNPTATEIIALKNRGIGPEILTAMLQRGGELRAQAARASAAVASPAAPAPAQGVVNPYAPVYDYSAQPAYPVYTYSYPAASYGYPSYSYAYPDYYYGGYNCGYSWPWYWPSFYFGCYPYRGYCGYSHCSSGYHYPYYYGGHHGGPYYGSGSYHGGSAYYGRSGYYGGSAYHGNGGYYGGAGHYRGQGYSGTGARPAPYTGQRAGFHSSSGGGRPTTFAGAGGGYRASGGASGRSVSFGGMSGGSRGGGGFGGHSMGRGR